MRQRSLLPRFGLRALFAFGVIFSLALAWIGKGLYRVRQEDAAIATLSRPGGGLFLEAQPGVADPPDIEFACHPYADEEGKPTPYLPDQSWSWARLSETVDRALGRSRRPVFASAEVETFGDGDPLVDATPAALSALPELRGVALMGEGFKNDSIKSLDSLSRLEALALGDTRITRDGLAGLSRPDRIQSLFIWNHCCETDLVSGVSSFSGVRKLEVSVTALSPDDIALIATLPNLEHLDVTSLSSEASCLAPIAGAKRLKRLSFSRYPKELFEEEARAIASLPELEFLGLNGFEKDLENLADGLPKLRELFLGYVSHDVAKEFSARRPECDVRVWQGNGELLFRKGEMAEFIPFPAR